MITNEFKSKKLLKKTPNVIKVAVISLLCIVFFVVGMLFVPWQQSVYGTGQVVAYSPTDRAQLITAPIEGVLNQWKVEEGSYVKKGQTLVTVENITPGYLKLLQEKKAALTLQVDAMQKSAQLAKKQIDRDKVLLDKGVGARRAYEISEQAYFEKLKEMGKAQKELATVEINIAKQQSREIKAPMSGTILNRRTGSGDVYVKSGDVIASLIPATASRSVELYLSGNDIPLVRVGDKVRLQFEGWPAIQFSAWPQLAIGTFDGIVKFVSPANDARGDLFKIIVSPEKGQMWPSSRFLRQGVPARGWVLLNQVSLGYELWRRYNGFPIHTSNRDRLFSNTEVTTTSPSNQ